LPSNATIEAAPRRPESRPALLRFVAQEVKAARGANRQGDPTKSARRSPACRPPPIRLRRQGDRRNDSDAFEQIATSIEEAIRAERAATQEIAPAA